MSDKDRSWFSERLTAVMRTHFGSDPVGQQTLYFGDMTNPAREYLRIEDTDKVIPYPVG